MSVSPCELRLVIYVTGIMLSTLLIIGLVVLGGLSENAPAIYTKLGKIKGHYKTSYEGNKYEAYEGIPYALPPVGDRRFEVRKRTLIFQN